jgi:5-methylcytosine-specific restriction endonuclease McrA
MSVEPRNGSTRAWRRVRAQVLAASTVCHLCGRPGSTTVDHLRPYALGGELLDPANLAPAHETCNKRRGVKDLADVAGSRDW